MRRRKEKRWRRERKWKIRRKWEGEEEEREQRYGNEKKNIRGEAGGEEYPQSGFRPGHSTKNVLIKTIDNWCKELDSPLCGPQ